MDCQSTLQNFHIMKEKTKRSVQPQKQQQTKESIPWYADLAIKDLMNPITISRVRMMQFGVALLILATAGYYAWDNFLRQPNGFELVDKMVDASGGMDAWNTIKEGQFTRTQYLYDQTGAEVSAIAQTFYFRKDKGSVQLKVKSQTKEGDVVEISKDDTGYWAIKANLPADPKLTSGELGMMCDSKWCNPDCAASMAFYRFSMPFKLRDNGVRPDNGSVTDFAMINFDPLKEVFGVDLQPLVLDVGYKPTVGKDRWKFYVHPETSLIYKIEYLNKADWGEYRPEEMFWTDHRTVDGITFSHQWHRYWGNGKIMEKYLFSDVDFTTELGADFFDRPDGHKLLSMK